MISFIVPAHNEELWIADCLSSIRDTMEAIDQPHEVVVVNDSSTDATVRIAEAHLARVVHVDHRHIARTRHAGALAGRGEVLFFIDADTRANPEAVGASLGALESGAVGGGCVFEFDCRLPLWCRILYPLGVKIGRLARLVGGCFLFCTRGAYVASGGFSTEVYAGEEIAFIRNLKKVGRFEIPKPTVVTSGRKLAVMGPWEVVALLTAIAIRGPYHKSHQGLDYLYGRRADQSKKSRHT